MTVSNLDFMSTVDAWVQKTEKRMTAVFRESTQRVTEIMINGVPVDTGFARASVQASLSEMPPVIEGSRGQEGQSYPLDFGQITTTIASAELGDTIHVGFTASYAPYLEFGHSDQAPNGFVRIAAEQWPQIVAEVTAEAKSRASTPT